MAYNLGRYGALQGLMAPVAPYGQPGAAPMAPTQGALTPGLMEGAPVAPPPQPNPGALQAPQAAPIPAPAPNTQPVQHPASAMIAASPQRAGYSPAIMAALARNQPGLTLGTPSPGAPPVQPEPYAHPTPLNVIKSPDPPPPETAGMLAAKEAAKNGYPSGLPNTVSEFLFGGSLGLDPFGTAKKNSSAIQDIARAMGQGKTITDSQWAQAGYGTGGK